MNKESLSKPIGIIGFVAMLLGAIDPLEGSLIIVPGAGLLALSAMFQESRRRRLLYLAFLMILIGVGVMFVFSWMGGIGGDSGRSMLLALLVLPYPIGWVLGLVAAIMMFKDSQKAENVAHPTE